jgi:hypothetical protein
VIDFPASPTLGQQFTAAGVTWVWDGTKWTASGLGVAYLPLAGGTLTGDLNLAYANPSIELSKVASGGGNYLYGRTGSIARWIMALGDSVAESGSNAGSNFFIYNVGDGGAAIGIPLAINRASGQVSIPNLVSPQAIGDNRIINGDFRIDQRNNGAAGTATQTYTADRWFYGANQTAKGTWQRNTGPAALAATGFPYFLQFTSSSAYAPLAGDFFMYYQPIEADMVSDFNWGSANAQPVTVSFWASASVAGIYGGSLKNSTQTRSYPFSFTLAANTWTKITVTIPGDTAGTWVMNGAAVSMFLSFDLGSGANFRAPANAWAAGNYVSVNGAVSVVATNAAAFYVTGVKLETGNVATPFNRQTLAKSLADCQRYYSTIAVVGQNYQLAGGSNIVSGFLPVAMRATPTLAILQNSSNSTATPTLSANSIGSFYATGTAAANQQLTINVLVSASAEL